MGTSESYRALVRRATPTLGAAVVSLLALGLSPRNARADVTFSSPVNYTVGNGPQSIATGDLNGDGLADLVTPNNSANTISVLLNNPLAPGTFLPAVHYPVDGGPMGLTVSDLNGDGRPDVAVACLTGSSVTVLTNVGAGILARAGSYAAGLQPTAVAAGALRRGGPVDLFVTNPGTGTISVLTGVGGGAFAGPMPVAVAAMPRAVTAGDFNGDGSLDVAVGGAADSTITILQGNGAGTLARVADIKVGGHPYGLTALPNLRTGAVDLIAANYSKGGVMVLRGNGNGSFDAPIYATAGQGPQAIGAGDFNMDGVTDYAVSDSFSKDAAVFIGEGAGVVPGPIVAPGLIRSGVVVADFNRDGLDDIATSNSGNTVSILLNNSVFVGSFTLRDASRPAGMGTRGTIALTGVAPPGGTVIPLSVDGNPSDPVATTPPSVTIPAGESSVSFDVVGWRQGVAVVTASINGKPQSVTLTVGPPPGETTNPGVNGDLDGDGRVTLNDAVLVLRAANGDGGIGS